MSLSDPQLEGLAAQAFNMARTDIERGTFNFLLASYHAGERLHRMRKIEQLVIERCGEDWLNSEPMKDHVFGLLRLFLALAPPEAMVFACVINKFIPTEKFDALEMDAQKKILTGGHPGHHRAVQQGYLRIVDALTAIAQTTERICIRNQGINADVPEVSFWAADEFEGRMKLYGGEVKV